MKISKQAAFLSGVIISVADISLATICYSSGSIRDLKHNFISAARSYDFFTNQFDLWILSLVRISLLFGFLIGFCMDHAVSVARSKNVSWAIVCFGLAMISYSPIKLLALDETGVDLMKAKWFWAFFTWNIVASILFAAEWLMFGIINIDSSTILLIDSEDDRVPILDHMQTNDQAANGAVAGSNNAVGKKQKKEEEPELSRKETFSLVIRLLRYCSIEWVLYGLGFFFLFLYSIVRIFIPYYTASVISTIVLTHSYADLNHSVLIMGALSLGSALFGGLRGGCFEYAYSKVGKSIRNDLFKSLVHQEIGFFDTTKTGEITSRLTADCQTMSDTVATNVNIFLRNLVMFVGCLVFMFKLSWQMTTITFAAIPLIAVISKIYGAYYDRLSAEAQDSIAKANEVADEVLSSMRTVRSFANENAESERYESRLFHVLHVNLKQTFAYTGYIWCSEFFDLSLLVAVLWYGGHLVLDNKLEKENLIAVLLYQLQLGETLMAMGEVYTGIMQSVGASRKVFQYIDRIPEIKNNGRVVSPQLEGKIEFRNVKLAYPSRKEVQVLNAMSFTVSPGETVALVGPSGGGKSSCISLLQHFYEPTAGQILLDGVSVKDYDHKFYHTKVSLVSQEPVLLGRSVSENIVYGLEMDIAQDEIEKVARMANAHDFILSHPDGYRTEVGEKGIQLSGGQKQRVAIARALIRSPKVLLLDEATSALDAESEHLVQEAIYQNLSGRTVILIAHRLSTVERANRIIVINKGMVEQQGTHHELLKEDGLYRNLVHRQLLGTGFMPSVKQGEVQKRKSVSQSSSSNIESEYQSPVGSYTRLGSSPTASGQSTPVI